MVAKFPAKMQWKNFRFCRKNLAIVHGNSNEKKNHVQNVRTVTIKLYDHYVFIWDLSSGVWNLAAISRCVEFLLEKGDSREIFGKHFIRLMISNFKWMWKCSFSLNAYNIHDDIVVRKMVLIYHASGHMIDGKLIIYYKLLRNEQ